ncbi:T9SS type A sorting domain-containing protein [bacterium]|nr:T9SS type A sorting domain-containing protein [bacterium]
MKRNITLSALALTVMFTVAWLGFDHSNERSYQPRVKAVQGIDGYAEYLAMIRNNQITGTVSQEEISKVVNQIRKESQKANKAEWPVKWSFSGPDNIGGRTRQILLDRNNPKIIYTGGVSGMMFKSENGGGSWRPLTLEDDNFGITCVGQTIDNTIYYGTGEGTFVALNARGAEEGTPGFSAQGVFKSTDGETFTQLTNTLGLGNINIIATHPTQNVVFIGTSQGLFYSDNGGDNWNILRNGNCQHITLNKNGVALAYVGGRTYRSTTPMVNGSYALVGDIGPGVRMVAAWSESDPDWCYVISVGSVVIDGTTYSDAVNGLYQSKDGGVSFTKIVDRASKYWAPATNIGVQSQGTYDLTIGVHPRNKERVFIGGVGFAEWNPEEGPKIVGNTFDSPQNPFGIHADKHDIVFDNTGEDPIMYIATDGGIFKTTDAELTRYKGLHVGFITTQFYGLAASSDGRILGGTQDNNTILISKESFPRKNGTTIVSGDGFQTEISQLNSNIMFGESQYGNLRRSVNGGQSIANIFDNRVRSEFVNRNRPNNIFNTAIHLWENPEAIERYQLMGRDSIVDSLYQARLFWCSNQGIWVANNAASAPHIPLNPSNETVRWFKVANITGVHHMTTTRDGNSLYVGTTGGAVYRVDGLNKVSYDTVVLSNARQISDSLTTTNITNNLFIGGRTVTGIAVDPNDDARLVITVGNYGNNTFVYRTENALDPLPNWTAIQSNLPRFPVYHAIIDDQDPDLIVLGTEYGIWACQNGSSSNPTWVESIEGVDADMPFPRVPVFEIRQVAKKDWTGSRIYAGTHGMGIWESESLLTSIEPGNAPKAKVLATAYPNPANQKINIETTIKGTYTANIYNMSGVLIKTVSGNSNGLINFSTAEFVNGNYFVEIIGNESKAVSKFIVQH